LLFSIHQFVLLLLQTNQSLTFVSHSEKLSRTMENKKKLINAIKTSLLFGLIFEFDYLTRDKGERFERFQLNCISYASQRFDVSE
jgi:hypothetical protein